MTDISRKVAGHALNYFHSNEGYQGGSFFVALFNLFGRADRDNQCKLATAYPQEFEAFSIATNQQEGLAKLRAIMNGTDGQEGVPSVLYALTAMGKFYSGTGWTSEFSVARLYSENELDSLMGEIGGTLPAFTPVSSIKFAQVPM